MIYFAYGSNMCTGRLRARVPSATPVRVAKLSNHSLRFHKRSTDGSGKGDAYFTGEQGDVIWGVIFEIDPHEKADLDRAEGLGRGYAEKQITVIDLNGHPDPLFMYAAEKTHIEPAFAPYSWYQRFVLEGARQHHLPADYITAIEAVKAIEDTDKKRDAKNRRILC